MHGNIIILALLGAACAGAQAQQAWRCGNDYGTQPCAGGRAVSAAAPADAADAARATAAAKVDAQRAHALEQARLEREKQAPRAIVMVPPPTAAPAAGGKAKPKKTAGGKGQPEAFTASAPGKKTKKKARPSS